MKLRIALLSGLCAVHWAGASAEDSKLETAREKFSYTIGLQIGQNLSQQGLSDLDPKAMAMAIEDVLAGREFRRSIQEMQAAGEAYQQELLAARESAAADNEGRSVPSSATTRSSVTAAPIVMAPVPARSIW